MILRKLKIIYIGYCKDNVFFLATAFEKNILIFFQLPYVAPFPTTNLVILKMTRMNAWTNIQHKKKLSSWNTGSLFMRLKSLLAKKTDIKQSKWDVSNIHYVKTSIKTWKTNLHILIRSIKVMANKRNLKRLAEKKKILVEIKQWQIPLYLKFGSKE